MCFLIMASSIMGTWINCSSCDCSSSAVDLALSQLECCGACSVTSAAIHSYSQESCPSQRTRGVLTLMPSKRTRHYATFRKQSYPLVSRLGLVHANYMSTAQMMKNSATRLMKLNEEEFSNKAWTLGLGSALTIVSGYYSELVVTGDLTTR